PIWDERSVAAFRKLAQEKGVEVSAHLSYPDRENFGRTTIDITPEALLASLDEQYALMNDVKMVKFHGALYNDCAADASLAALLAGWLEKQGINRVMTPFDSELAGICAEKGMEVVPEAFAERRYAWSRESGKLSLVSRTREFASIHDLDEAVAHSKAIYLNQSVLAYEDDALMSEPTPLQAQTICIHSDSEIALELAEALNRELGES
ncbi:MAG: LamB/YcsF family protein, partial [Spirochaetales bacterium]|nr:LamB/YcsF family protein [Spirochaetales bacterium]